ncbi:MAG: peptidoglycan-binding protein [Clostridiales bacterium]|nr:peptidoglycan-binding protein [Clostridiales bacterium]
MKKFLATVLVLAISLSIIPAGMTTVFSEGFTFVEITEEEYSTVVNQYYTPIQLNGIEQQVFAFTDTQGQTAFRVYGTYNGQTGFYPVEVSADEEFSATNDETGVVENSYVYTIIPNPEEGLANDTELSFGVGQGQEPQPGEVNEGYTKMQSPAGFYYFRNVFYGYEYRVWAAFDGENQGLYKANQEGVMLPGALAIVGEDDLQAKYDGKSMLAKPASLEKGWQQLVIIHTVDGSHQVPTDQLTIEQALEEAGSLLPEETTDTEADDKKDSSGGKGSSGNLSLGAVGGKVTDLTNSLVKLGYLSSSTSTFDDTVKKAVITFQKDNKLKADGIVGKATRNKINEAVNALSNSKTVNVTVNYVDTNGTSLDSEKITTTSPGTLKVSVAKEKNGLAFEKYIIKVGKDTYSAGVYLSVLPAKVPSGLKDGDISVTLIYKAKTVEPTTFDVSVTYEGAAGGAKLKATSPGKLTGNLEPTLGEKVFSKWVVTIGGKETTGTTVAVSAELAAGLKSGDIKVVATYVDKAPTPEPEPEKFSVTIRYQGAAGNATLQAVSPGKLTGSVAGTIDGSTLSAWQIWVKGKEYNGGSTSISIDLPEGLKAGDIEGLAYYVASETGGEDEGGQTEGGD